MARFKFQCTSKYKYIYFHKKRKKYRAQYKTKFLGDFETELEAKNKLDQFLRFINYGKI